MNFQDFLEICGMNFFRRFHEGPFRRGPRGGLRPQPRLQNMGSGFIVTDTGLVVTNNHVVESASKITVRFNDQKKRKAKVVGRDPQTDIAPTPGGNETRGHFHRGEARGTAKNFAWATG